jgi:molybdopterin converting factor small subunit
MRIRVYAPPFARIAAIDEGGYVSLPEGATLNELFKALRLPFRRGAARLCLVNYEKASLDSALKDGDIVSFFALASGG